LEGWHEFYLLIGTAGLTLTGLLFVVVSLGPRVVASHEATGVRAFISPNAVYFTTTLVVSAILALTKVHRQWRDNKLPVLDWAWFVGLPIAAYVLLLLSGVGFVLNVALAGYAVAAALILLLVIGIRNAWDLVIWISRQEHK